MNLSQLNEQIVSGHKQEQLLLSEPKKETNREQEKVKTEVLKDNKIGDFYTKQSELTKEVNHYKAGNTNPYSSSGYSSGYKNSNYGSNNSNSKVGLYGGGNLNYNERINNLRKKSKEIAKQEKENGEMIPYKGDYNFSIKNGKVKKKRNIFKKKGGKLLKQIGVAVATICLEVALASLISTAKTSVEKIADEVKNVISGKVVVANA